MLPFLMFQGGRCEEAIRFWLSVFPDGTLEELVRFGPGGAGPEDSVMQAKVRLAGQTVRCFDSPVPHQFDFTPSFSFFVECPSEAELDRLYAALSAGGKVMMAPADYGFSRKFAWVGDRFGVSWQLNLAS
jgi:predicted 3-demethylubiquinone-9 3-methyltransferase (glyoxalase superfamily)